MTAEQWEKIKELFEAALERDGSQRAAFLDGACASDPSLRAEIEALIASHEQAGSFMAEPALEPGTKLFADDGAESLVGRRIGPYKILREIGQGGMGTVYLAARADDEYQKQVAIKIVKRGMDTEAIIRRFRNERQILANLDHPNIAKLLDGGTTEDGLPYFVMDYIEGLPIHMYCDTHKRSTVERLKLFQTTCSAVHYAHHHDVVHRDIKPSNILVTAEGVAKLLDFGIAKLLNPDPSSQTKETTSSLRPMTPDYASPEQVRGEPITPASDVYSLGVLLYELLTGHRPYYVKNRTPQEIERTICEEEPKKPSTAISRIEEVAAADGTNRITLTPESVSEARGDQPEKLRRHLAGDLDNMVLMALRKEPERRYASVEQLSEDIRRHLEGLPVIARKDTLWYRSAKFIKRNKTSVRSAAVASMVLLLVGVGVYLLTARSQIDSIAVLPFVNVSADPNIEYLSDGISETLMNRLSQLPNLKVLPRTSVFRYKGKEQDSQTVGRTLKVQAVITGKVAQSGDNLSISAELIDVRNNRHLWGDKYTRKLSEILVLQEEITRQLSKQLRTRLTGAERGLLAKRQTENAAAYRQYLMGRHFWNQRTAAGIQKSIKYFEKATELDPTYALAYATLGDSYTLASTYGVLPAKEAYLKAKGAALKGLEIDNALAEGHTTLGIVSFYHDWDWVAAERAFKRAIELKPDDATAHQRYALALGLVGRFDEAIAEIKRARELDPFLLIIHANVGQVLYQARQYDEAIDELRKALGMDPNFFQARRLLGQVHVQKQMYDEAFAEFQKAISLSGGNAMIKGELGHAYAVSGRRDEAMKVLDELLELSRRRYVSPFAIALVYTGLGEKDQAIAWLEKSAEERARLILSLKVNPVFDRLRSDPRFTDLRRRVGLVN
jgi:serine/threonine protein kinase/Flp pilus assembly protein TadD